MKKSAIVTTVSIVAFSILTPFSMKAAEDGAALYKAKCAGCHAADGGGATTMGKKMGLKDLKGPEVQKMTDAELIAIIAEGGKEKKASHAFKSKGVSEAQVQALVGYIRSIAKK